MTPVTSRSRYLRTFLGVILVLVVSFGAVIGIKKLSKKETTQNSRLPVVVATVPHIASWLESIGSGAIAVETLVPPGTEVHDFSFDPSAATSLGRAVLLVANGAELEEWLPEVRAAQPDLTIIETAQELELTVADPHTWLDPLFAIEQVQTASRALQLVVPSSASEISQATTDFVTELQTLDTQTRATLSALPDNRFVAFHNAFGYFARRYGLEQVGELVERPGDEPTFADVDALSKAVRDFGITTLFVEPGPAPDLANSLAAELGLNVAVLDPLETISPSAGSYLTGMQNNVNVLSSALDKNGN